MGVKGLATYVAGLAHPDGSPGALPGGTLVLIDGNGWMHHLLRQVPGREHLGAYQALDALVRAQIKVLSKAQLRVSVFFDGSVRVHKSDALRKRQESQAEQWEALYEYCLDGRRPADDDKLPPPPLLLEQVRGTLEDLHVPICQSEGEADFDLAYAAAHAPNAVVWASDSDFLVTRGVRYAPFGGSEVLPGVGLVAAVWTRAAVAELMGLSEAALVEMALLLGNDYTMGFGPGDYAGLGGEVAAALGRRDVEGLRAA
eukprot:CAMPEP_0118870090 /NCGR_PEP_ID=MMETSP1163-20130328/13187_1 /TAXON_ID=124430 /ORGANISM="Phaeomonas parva, Strain CCMP2877" /LENGTH=256 /DNA_ID=CAMNT_0006805041 /DNA_START=148 /DNA_END=915 /DNA_ORIENTATION=+